MKLLSF